MPPRCSAKRSSQDPLKSSVRAFSKRGCRTRARCCSVTLTLPGATITEPRRSALSLPWSAPWRIAAAIGSTPRGAGPSIAWKIALSRRTACTRLMLKREGAGIALPEMGLVNDPAGGGWRATCPARRWPRGPRLPGSRRRPPRACRSAPSARTSTWCHRRRSIRC